MACKQWARSPTPEGHLQGHLVFDYPSCSAPSVGSWVGKIKKSLTEGTWLKNQVSQKSQTVSQKLIHNAMLNTSTLHFRCFIWEPSPDWVVTAYPNGYWPFSSLHSSSALYLHKSISFICQQTWLTPRISAAGWYNPQPLLQYKLFRNFYFYFNFLL